MFFLCSQLSHSTETVEFFTLLLRTYFTCTYRPLGPSGRSDAICAQDGARGLVAGSSWREIYSQILRVRSSDLSRTDLKRFPRESEKSGKSAEDGEPRM